MTVVEESGTEPKCFKQLRCFTLFSVVSLPYAFSCLKSILLDGEQTELNSSVFFLSVTYFWLCWGFVAVWASV